MWSFVLSLFEIQVFLRIGFLSRVAVLRIWGSSRFFMG
jgi:hypothetical protein